MKAYEISLLNLLLPFSGRVFESVYFQAFIPRRLSIPRCLLHESTKAP